MSGGPCFCSKRSGAEGLCGVLSMSCETLSMLGFAASSYLPEVPSEIELAPVVAFKAPNESIVRDKEAPKVWEHCFS
jgi:hypothetical protein